VGTGTQQPPLHGAGRGHPVEHGDDRGSPLTQPGRLSEGAAGLGKIKAGNAQYLGNLLDLSIVDLGGQAEQATRHGDSSSHGGVAGPRPVAVEAGVAHAKLTLRGVGGCFEHRPRPPLTHRSALAAPQAPGASHPLPPERSEAKRVDREVPAVCPAPEQRERKGRTGLACPPVMSHETTRTTTGSDMRAPVDAQRWPKLAVAFGHVRSAHKRPRPALAAAVVMRE
jgi:hypothetical protein